MLVAPCCSERRWTRPVILNSVDVHDNSEVHFSFSATSYTVCKRRMLNFFFVYLYKRQKQFFTKVVISRVNSTLIETKNIENKIEGGDEKDFYFHTQSFSALLT